MGLGKWMLRNGGPGKSVKGMLKYLSYSSNNDYLNNWRTDQLFVFNKLITNTKNLGIKTNLSNYLPDQIIESSLGSFPLFCFIIMIIDMKGFSKQIYYTDDTFNGITEVIYEIVSEKNPELLFINLDQFKNMALYISNYYNNYGTIPLSD